MGAKEFVIEEKVSRVNSLSLVLSGRLLVSQVGIIIVTIAIAIIIIFVMIFVNIIFINANARLAGGKAPSRRLGEPVPRLPGVVWSHDRRVLPGVSDRPGGVLHSCLA